MSHDEEPQLSAADGPVADLVPASMLTPRIVPVGPTGVKEPPDPSKVVVVKYDAFMQVVNGMAGSAAGNMRRLSEILRDAVDGSADQQFRTAIEQATEKAAEDARVAALEEAAERTVAALEEKDAQLAELQADLSIANLDITTLKGRIVELEADVQKAVNTQAELAERIQELETINGNLEKSVTSLSKDLESATAPGKSEDAPGHNKGDKADDKGPKAGR